MTTPGPQHRVAGTMASGLGRLGRLARKELSEILRDRRTIVTLVLMPVLLYPLLSIAFQQFFLAGVVSARKAPKYRLAFLTEREAELVYDHLRLGNRALARQANKRNGKHDAPRLQVEDPYLADNLTEPVVKGAVDLAIRVRNGEQVVRDRRADLALDCELYYLETSALGRGALDYVERRLAAANNVYLERRLGAHGREPRAVLLRTERAAVADPEHRGTVSLGALIPLILILMTITGAVYPAIDLTAGERERGTLEILVAAPVPRLGLLFAKYVSVVTVAVLTALVNLATMTATLLLSGLGPLVFGNAGLSWLLVLQLFGLLLLFAAFFSAVLLMLTSFARSFKEAQAYLIPLMLVSLAPGLLGMMPGLKLSGIRSVVPLLNVVLLARDLFEGTADPTMAVVVIVSTLFYALAALAGAARIFGAEGVLYNEQTGWSDLFRRPRQPRTTASVSGALFGFALLFPAYFVVNSLLARVASDLRPVLSGLATVVLFGVLPLLAALWDRVQLATGFQWHRASLAACAGAALIGAALAPLMHELLALVRDLGLTLLGPEQEQQLRTVVSEWRTLSPVLIVIAYGVVPAVIEELFFRGYLFSALRAGTRMWTTVGGSAVLFGLFHGATLLDRFLPSTLLGVILGWVCWRTRSVFPGMLLHGSYNTLFLLAAYFQSAPR